MGWKPSDGLRTEHRQSIFRSAKRRYYPFITPTQEASGITLTYADGSWTWVLLRVVELVEGELPPVMG